MPNSEVLSLAFAFSMGEEGGERYTDDPRDAGGPTKYGVCLAYNRAVIPDKDGNGVIDARDVQALTEADARRIYETVYWAPHKCDRLPGPLALMYADMVFNPGPGAAPKLLQQALNAVRRETLAVDGKIGPATLAAVERADLESLLVELAARRQGYYASRPQWAVYGNGWTRRTLRSLTAAQRLLWGVA